MAAGVGEEANFAGEKGAARPRPGDRVRLKHHQGTTARVVHVHTATQLDLMTPLEVQVDGEYVQPPTQRVAIEDVMAVDDDEEDAPQLHNDPHGIVHDARQVDDPDRVGVRVQQQQPRGVAPNLVVGTDTDAVHTLESAHIEAMRAAQGAENAAGYVAHKQPRGGGAADSGGGGDDHNDEDPEGGRVQFGALVYGKLLALWTLDLLSAQVRYEWCIISPCVPRRASSSHLYCVPSSACAPPTHFHPQVAPAAQEFLQRALDMHPPSERPGLRGSTPAVVLGLVAVVVFQAVYTVYDLLREAVGVEFRGERGLVVDSVVLAALCTLLLSLWLRV